MLPGPRPSELGRAQEMGHVWVSDVRCPTAAIHRSQNRTTLVCTPERPLLPGIASVVVQMHNTSEAQSPSSPSACEETLRRAALEPRQGRNATSQAAINATMCIAVGLQGPLQLVASQRWEQRIGAGE